MIVTVILIFSLSMASSHTPVPSGYEKGSDGLFYKFHPEKLSWDEAYVKCMEEGAQLATEETERTHDFLKSRFGSTYMWIAGTEEDSGIWMWKTPLGGKSPVETTHWADGRPNNLGGPQECICTNFDNAPGQWDDGTCSSKLAFLCQFQEEDSGCCFGRDVCRKKENGNGHFDKTNGKMPGQKTETDALTLREVKFIGGSVGASSIYSASSSWKASNAFLQGSNDCWHSGRNAAGSGEVAVAYPHIIWYNFKEAFNPAMVSFRPRQGTGCDPGRCGATKYQFVGTNDQVCDQYSKWTVLCEDMSGEVFKSKKESKYCPVKQEMTKAFKCLGISVWDSSFTGASEVSMNGIRIWRRN